jgi:hypothetical protein
VVAGHDNDRKGARDGAQTLQTRNLVRFTVDVVAPLTGTPWGRATVIDEIRLRQQAGGKRFASVVQLLESREGERFVRFAYTTNGLARRGPVTLRTRDIEKLRVALGNRPELAEALRL